MIFFVIFYFNNLLPPPPRHSSTVAHHTPLRTNWITFSKEQIGPLPSSKALLLSFSVPFQILNLNSIQISNLNQFQILNQYYNQQIKEANFMIVIVQNKINTTKKIGTSIVVCS